MKPVIDPAAREYHIDDETLEVTYVCDFCGREVDEICECSARAESDEESCGCSYALCLECALHAERIISKAIDNLSILHKIYRTSEMRRKEQ